LRKQNTDIVSVTGGGKYCYDTALNAQLDTDASTAEHHSNDTLPK